MADPRQPLRPPLGIVALGVAAFVVLCSLELLTEDEPLRPLDVLGMRCRSRSSSRRRSPRACWRPGCGRSTKSGFT